MVQLASPSAPTHVQTGALGEQAAEAYLQRIAHRILARNVRLGRCELDIIAYDEREHMLVFVEVKARRNYCAAYPIHTAVNRRKRQALRRAVDAWITLNEYCGPARIDIVCVGAGRITEHIRDIGSDFLVDI